MRIIMATIIKLHTNEDNRSNHNNTIFPHVFTLLKGGALFTPPPHSQHSAAMRLEISDPTKLIKGVQKNSKYKKTYCRNHER